MRSISSGKLNNLCSRHTTQSQVLLSVAGLSHEEHDSIALVIVALQNDRSNIIAAYSYEGTWASGMIETMAFPSVQGFLGIPCGQRAATKILRQ
jgi:hypothetical protein